MLSTLLLALAPALLSPAARAADCGSPTFSFVGQPACVSLAYDGQHTWLENDCTAPLLVDVSVLDGVGGGPTVAPGARARLRDLSAFSLGLEGELHRAVAVVELPECPAAPTVSPGPVPAPEADPEPSILHAVLAVVLPG